MALHERAQLRAAVVAQLVGTAPTYATAAGARVTSARPIPLVGTDVLPAISVYTNEETIDEASKRSNPRELKRRPVVQVEGWVTVAAGGDVDAAMDALALQIETAMDGDQGHDSCAFDSVLGGTEFARDMTGARPLGCVTLSYEITYHTGLRVTESPDDFDTMHTTTKIDGVDMPAADDAENLNLGIHE